MKKSCKQKQNINCNTQLYTTLKDNYKQITTNRNTQLYTDKSQEEGKTTINLNYKDIFCAICQIYKLYLDITVPFFMIMSDIYNEYCQ